MVALGITSLQITHKKTGKNRKEPATKKPVNTRFYRLLNFLTFVSAERAGFEPAIPFRVYTLSRRAPSTTRTPLLIKISQRNFKLDIAGASGRPAARAAKVHHPALPSE